MLIASAALLSIAVFGLTAVLAVDPRARGAKLAGLAWFYGCGLVHFTLLAFSLLGIPWTLVMVQVALIAVTFLLWIVWRRRSVKASIVVIAERRTAYRLLTHLVDLLTVTTVALYAAYATAVRMWQWDFWSIWGLKGRVFFEARGLDWRFLESRWNTGAHPDYPLLLPLQFDYLALFAGAWDDRWSGLIAAAFVAAMLLVVRQHLAARMSPLLAAGATLAATGFAVTPFVGLADGPLVAMIGAALLLGNAAAEGESREFVHAALLLGLASITKNEGVSLLVAAALVMALTYGYRAALRLWPALLVAAPWLVLRATHALSTDVMAGPVLPRLQSHLGEVSLLVRMLVTVVVEPWIVALVLLAFLVGGVRQLVRVRFMMGVTLLQFFFYAGAYLVSPHPVAWHVTTSWPRISAHLAMPLLLAAMLILAACIEVEEDAPHAEARPRF